MDNLPQRVLQLQNEIEHYKAALLRIAKTPRIDGKCPYCSATMTLIGKSNNHVRITPHDENCPVKIAEKALS